MTDGGDGRALEAVVADDGPLAPAGVARVVVDVGSRIEGQVHGGLSPSSVVLVGGDEDEHAEPRDAAVDPRCEAPELADGEAPTAESDVYAMGCVAFEALVAVPPFRGSAAHVRLSHRHDPLPSVGSEPLDAVLAKATAKDPRARYGSVAELGRALERAASRSAKASVAIAPVSRPRRPVVEEPEPDADPMSGGLPVVLGIAVVIALIVAWRVLAAVGDSVAGDSSDDDPLAAAPAAVSTTTTTRTATTPKKTTGASGPTGPVAPATRIAPEQTTSFTAAKGGYIAEVPAEPLWANGGEKDAGGVLRTTLTGPAGSQIYIESTSGTSERPLDRTGLTGVVRSTLMTPNGQATSYRFLGGPGFCTKGCLRDQSRVGGRLITVLGGPTAQARGAVRAITLSLQGVN